VNIVIPQTVSDAILTSSNITEDEAAQWYIGTTYAVDDQAIYKHKLYTSLVNDNIGSRPDEGVDEDPPTWFEEGPTNRYAMFDGKLTQGSSNADSIELTFQSSRVVDALVFFNLVGSSLNVEVTDADEVVQYTATVPLSAGEPVNNWWDYFFAEFGQLTDVALVDLPSVAGLTINVTINNDGGIAQCGELVMGGQRSIGDTQYGASLSIRDYSRKDEDEFGNPIIVERPYAKVGDFDVILQTNTVSNVHRFLASVRAQAAVYIGGQNHEATVIYGFFKSFEIVLSGPVVSDCAIRIEGLV
jgi:hypothetical protein